jgi:uncharacterized protein YjbI with pentapeptide repeats
MPSEGKNGRDDGPAQGWDLFTWRWVTEPPEGLTAAVYGILFILLFLIAVSGIVALWQLLVPIWIGASPAPSADPGAELRGRLLIIGALLTTPFLIWRLIVGHWAARAAQAQVRVAQEQARIAQETARNTLFTKAIEQLGAVREKKTTVTTKDTNGVATSATEESAIRPNIEVRLGAIYALEKLARDDIEMHWPIMETLCAYIRENAGKPKPPPTGMSAALSGHWRNRLSENAVEKLERESDPPSVDVQAAITVIGRRGAKQLEYERSRREDEMSKAANAWRLDLSNCHLALSNYVGLDFTAARFEGSSLYLADFSGAALAGAVFSEAHLEGASFYLAHLEGASLGKAHLEGAGLTEAHIENAGFAEAALEGAWLNKAHLEGASLGKACLKNALLDGTHLDGALLTEANLNGASLDHALLADAGLDGADLGKAESVDQTPIEAARGDQETILPDNCTRPRNERWLPDKFSVEDVFDRGDRWDARHKFWRAEAEKRRKGPGAPARPIASEK